MKMIGALLILFTWWSLSITFTWSALAWMFVGIFLIATEECISFFAHTERFIHRSNNDVKK